eukprot:1179830-Prorocentrum_minimum.AAC.1
MASQRSTLTGGSYRNGPPTPPYTPRYNIPTLYTHHSFRSVVPTSRCCRHRPPSPFGQFLTPLTPPSSLSLARSELTGAELTPFGSPAAGSRGKGR